MITLNYPTQNKRWGYNELNFESWKEYWKTLGYLSNPNVHRHNNPNGNINIIFERNAQTQSYTDTSRIYYYGNEQTFSREFPSLYLIRRGSRGTETFRINRKEFGETLIEDLGFQITQNGQHRDGIILPPQQSEILSRIQNNLNFDRDAWDEGYSLGNI